MTLAALMKIHAVMARETVKEVNEPTLEPCRKVFETYFLPEKQRSLTDCLNCHDGDDMHLCMCARDMLSFYDWNEGLRTVIHDTTLFEESETLNNLTEPTDNSLVTSLAILSLPASAKAVKHRWA